MVWSKDLDLNGLEDSQTRHSNQSCSKTTLDLIQDKFFQSIALFQYVHDALISQLCSTCAKGQSANSSARVGQLLAQRVVQPDEVDAHVFQS